MTMPRPVLVTGATGFLGRYVVRELTARGRAVHALARSSSDRSTVQGPVVWHEGDLADPESVDAAARAVAAGSRDAPPDLVHGAATISYRDEDRDHQRLVNVGGTRAVLEAARRHGFERVVHVSSVVTVAHAPDAAALDEYAEWNGAELGVDYVTTKHEAEVLARSFADALDVRIVNPAVVFGPWAAANSSRMIAAVARGGVGPLAPPGGISVVGVEDVARGVALALEEGQRGRRYILAESYYGLRDLFRTVVKVLAVEGLAGRHPRGTVPRGLWPVVVRVARWIARRRELEHATPQALVTLGCRWRLSGDRARRELGWKPAPFEDVLLDAVRGLREQGVL